MTEPILLWGTTATELDVFGERLHDARVIQRLKGQAVAEAAQLAPDRYSRLETSLSTPVDALRSRQLANASNFPVQFLTAPPVTPVQRGSLLFRAKKAMTRREENQLVAWARLIGDLLQRAVQESVRLRYLRVSRIPDGISPMAAAAMTRKATGIDPEAPIPHLTYSLERVGVYIATLDFSGRIACETSMMHFRLGLVRR